MLVSIPLDGEEGVLKRLRECENYKSADFYNSYYTHINDADSVVNAAKVYILDNYKKIDDWAELNMKLYYRDETIDFGLKDAERKKRYPKKKETEFDKRRVARAVTIPRLNEILQEIDNKKIQIETINDVVYDWTDGDFSIQINGTWFNCINYNNQDTIIEIANFIKNKIT